RPYSAACSRRRQAPAPPSLLVHRQRVRPRAAVEGGDDDAVVVGAVGVKTMRALGKPPPSSSSASGTDLASSRRRKLSQSEVRLMQWRRPGGKAPRPPPLSIMHQKIALPIGILTLTKKDQLVFWPVLDSDAPC